MKKRRNQNLSMQDAMHRYRGKLPAIYRIVVSGVLDPDWSDRLGGLRIESGTGYDPNEPVTVLEGHIKDQAQLSGILSTLFGLRCTLLSVKKLKIIENDT